MGERLGVSPLVNGQRLPPATGSSASEPAIALGGNSRAKQAGKGTRGSGCFDPVVSFDLPLPLPVTDAEILLVAAYLGDVISQILSEPE